MKIFGLEIRLAGSSNLAKPDQWLIDALTGGTTNAGVIVNDSTAIRLSAVWACIKVLSESIATLPIILYKRNGDSKSRATGHPLYPILHDMANSEMTAYDFKQVMMVHLCLRGNAYAEIERDRLGRVIGLWPITLDQYQVIPKRANGAIVYEVNGLLDAISITLPAERVLHIKGLGMNGLIGLSPIEQARQGIGLGLAADEYGARFFGNGANVGGVLQHPGNISKDALERLREQFEDRYSGVSRSHKTAILEEGMTYNRIGLAPADAAFIETRKYQATDIARIFRVPPHMIGDLERATWANIEQQGIEFVVHTLGPWMRNWEQAITWKLLTERERQEYFTEFLVDAFLRGDIQSRYSAYATGRSNGWLSANDIRRLENMDPIDGGDIYLVPLNMVPSDQAGSRSPKEVPGGGSSTRRSSEGGDHASSNI